MRTVSGVVELGLLNPPKSPSSRHGLGVGQKTTFPCYRQPNTFSWGGALLGYRLEVAIVECLDFVLRGTGVFFWEQVSFLTVRAVADCVRTMTGKSRASNQWVP